MTPHGTVAAGFDAVRDAFAANFEDHDEAGAAVCVWHRGREVVSLHGGVADARTGRPWSADTIVPVFSMSKSLTTVCVLQLAERGRIDLDAPVARYWPEFAAHGKGAITLRTVMAHRAGLPALDGEFTLDDALAWVPVVDALADATPEWEPGTAHGYHARTFGWLVGETFRRAAGCTVGQWAAVEIAAPFAIDWYLGLPPALEARVARLIPPGAEYFALIESLPDDLLLRRALGAPGGVFRYDEVWNEPRVHATELPSSNSITNAAAAARFHAALLGDLDGVTLVRPDTLADARRPQSTGPDRVLMIDTAFGTGFQLASMYPPAVGPRTFGHPGAGGAVAFADPDADLAFAYTPNRMRLDMQIDPRSDALVRSVYESVARE